MSLDKISNFIQVRFNPKQRQGSNQKLLSAQKFGETPSYGVVLRDNPTVLTSLNGQDLDIRDELLTGSDKDIQNFLSSENIDVFEFGKQLFINGIREVAQKFPPVGQVILNFVIQVGTQIPTIGVRFNAEDGRYYLYYNPKFVSYFAIQGAAYDYFLGKIIVSDLLNIAFYTKAIKFALIHEVMHIVKGHTSALKGQIKVKALENIVYDSQINTELSNLLKGDIPAFIKEGGVGEGIFITNPFIKDKLMGENLLYSEIAMEIAGGLKREASAFNAELENVIYFYINTSKLFKKYNPDLVIEAILEIEEKLCDGNFTQRPNRMPDILEESIARNAFNRSGKNPYSVGDVIFNLDDSQPYVVKEEKMIKKRRDMLIEVESLDEDDLGKVSKIPLRLTRKTIRYKLQVGSLMQASGGVRLVIGVKDNPSPVFTKYKTIGSKEAHQFADEDFKSWDDYVKNKIRVYLFGYEVEKVFATVQKIFVKDIVRSRFGTYGLVKKADFAKNYYEVRMNPEYSELLQEFGGEDLMKVEEKQILPNGSLVSVKQSGEVGYTFDFDYKTSKYKIAVISPEEMVSLLSREIVSGDVTKIGELELLREELNILTPQKQESDQSDEMVEESEEKGTEELKSTEELDRTEKPDTEETTSSEPIENPNENDPPEDIDEKESTKDLEEGGSDEPIETKPDESSEAPEGPESEEGKEDAPGEAEVPSEPELESEDEDNDLEETQEGEEGIDQETIDKIKRDLEEDSELESLEEDEAEDRSEEIDEDDDELGRDFDPYGNDGSPEDDFDSTEDNMEELEDAMNEASDLEDEFGEDFLNEMENTIEQDKKHTQSNLDDKNEIDEEDVTFGEEDRYDIDDRGGSGVFESENVELDRETLKDLPLDKGTIESFNKMTEPVVRTGIKWEQIIRRAIKDVTGIATITDQQSPSRRLPGVFENEEDIPEFKSVGIIFDTSGSMSHMQSKKSLEIVAEVFKGPEFRKCIIFIMHYASEMHHFKKMRRFTKPRFMALTKSGFSESGGTKFEKAFSDFHKLTKPKPDFILHLTDGEFNVGYLQASDRKGYMLKRRVITVIVDEASEKSNRSYRQEEARMKKNYILGARKR